jgi:hypothetical protein
MGIAWGQIAAAAVFSAAATRMVGGSLNRAQDQARRVQAEATQFRAWYLTSRSRFIDDPPGFGEADALLAQIGIQALRRLVVAWYNFRVRHGDLDPSVHADETMRAMARWPLAEYVLDPVLSCLAAGRALAHPAVDPVADPAPVHQSWQAPRRGDPPFEADGGADPATLRLPTGGPVIEPAPLPPAGPLLHASFKKIEGGRPLETRPENWQGTVLEAAPPAELQPCGVTGALAWASVELL